MMRLSVPVLLLLLFASCSKQGETSQQTVTASGLDTAYCQPFFEDDGTMAALYEANGYVYSKDLESAAANGDMGAQKILVNMYAYGIGGVKPNVKRTYQLYRSLAEAGDAEAQAYTGYMLVYGAGPVEDVEMGLQWLEKSANMKCPIAYYFLADYFRKTGDDRSADKFSGIYDMLTAQKDTVNNNNN